MAKPKHESVRQKDLPAELKKPPEAIFVKVRGGRLTLLMHKAYNVLVARAAEKPRNMSTYRVSLKELGVDIQFDRSHNIDALKDMLRRLNVTQVEWGLAHGGSTEWGVSTMLAGAKIIGNELEYSFAPQIKDKLLDPHIFARINLRLMAGFRSRPGLALYEACYRYISNPGGVTARMPWETWRDVLCEMSGPKEWRYFNRDVLKPSVQEVNAVVPDMEVEPILYRGKGGRVNDLQFRVIRKRQGSLDLESGMDVSPNQELVTRLCALGFGEDRARRLAIEHDEGSLRVALSVTESRMRSRQAAPLENPAAFFTKALAEGYRPPKQARRQADQEKDAQDHTNTASSQGDSAYRAYQQMSPEAQRELLGEFVDQVVNDNQMLSSEMAKKGLRSAIVRGHFKVWLLARGGRDQLFR